MEESLSIVKEDNFDITLFINEIEKNYINWNPPVLSFISSRKDFNPFQILISTILSLRARDKVTKSVSTKLLRKANNPKSILSLGITAIERIIYSVGFYRIKAERIVKISRVILNKYSGVVPNNIDELLSLPGVGRKTANLVLSEGFGIPSICVDTHVHRISNRTGYVSTTKPEDTERILIKKLPKKYWSQYNKLLVALGQIMCLPIMPNCTKCPVSFICNHVGINQYK